MSTRTPIKRIPVTGVKQPGNKADSAKIRPSTGPDKRLKHAVWSLADLLKKKNLDGRLSVVKERNRIEARWVDDCGGAGCLTAHMISLIKRIAVNEIIILHGEDMALVGEFDITSKNFLALENTHRRNMDSLDKLIKDNKGKTKSLEDYIESKAGK